MSKLNRLKIFDDMLFEGINCCMFDCLFNLSGICTSESHNIQPINIKQYLSCEKIKCKKFIEKLDN